MNETTLLKVPTDFYTKGKFPRLTMQHLLMGEQALAKGEMQFAFKCAQEAMVLDPDHPGVQWLRAQLAIKMEDWGLAALILKNLSVSHPTSEIFNNCGSAYVSMQRSVEAEEWFRKALKRDPKCRPAYNNMALCKVHNAEFEAAEHYTKKALECAEEFYKSGKWDRAEFKHWDTLETLGYSQLARKNFKEGWHNYNAMVGFSKSRPWKPIGNEPRLTPEAFVENRGKGAKLYIRGEQGIGDEIHFASLLEQAHHDFDILYDADEVLMPLLQRSFPYVEMFPFRKGGTRNYGREYKPDFHCLLGELAEFYRRDEESFPGNPFLTVDPELQAMWKARMAFYPGLKVGFTFTGGIKRTYKVRRTIDLPALTPLFDIPYATFFCLGWEGDTAEELDAYIAPRDTGRVVYFKETLSEHGQKNYDHVAALVDQMDIIVSVPQSAVHLAGALGKKVVVLAPETARWFYWQTRGNTDMSIWYPNVKILRQHKGQWPIQEAVEIVKGMSPC